MSRGSEWIRRRVVGALGPAPPDEAVPCMYGPCVVVVLAGSGWRHNGLVFCSEEHARRDAEE